MNSLLFEDVLDTLNKIFKAQDKKILLLVDNAPSHFDPHDKQDNNDNESDEQDNFGEEGSTLARLRGNFQKNYAKMSKLTHGKYYFINRYYIAPCIVLLKKVFH